MDKTLDKIETESKEVESFKQNIKKGLSELKSAVNKIIIAQKDFSIRVARAARFSRDIRFLFDEIVRQRKEIQLIREKTGLAKAR